jgi:hypothetical protein
MKDRRLFLAQTTIISLGIVGSRLLQAQPAMVSESDPMAKQLNFVTNATKVDKQKATTYQPGQKCGGCQLFQGAAGAAAAPCAIFSGKQVPATGWCSAYAKKS